MNWLDKLEKNFGYLGLEGLIRYISMLMLTVFFLNYSQILPYEMLYLHWGLITSGQVWRIFTFLLIPASGNIFFLMFELSILVMCADGLEARWGTFKLTAYYFAGAISNILIAILLPEVQLGSYFIYLSLFIGFATLYPDHEILLFFIIPVKMKYLAMFSGGVMLYQLALAPWYLKVAILLSLGNYLLFFSREAWETIRRNQYQARRSAEYAQAMGPAREFRHKCQICGATDVTAPDLQFRYCTCKNCGNDGKAFCLEHLEKHRAEKAENI